MSTTTQAQIDANRANATHSTGPTTEAGKQTCSQNSLKHGLASSRLIIAGEREEDFNALLTLLIGEHKPATPTETLIVQNMAKHQWLADRAMALQSEALTVTLAAIGDIPKSLGLLIRYQTTNERAFQKDLAALHTLRKQRQTEIGSASQTAVPQPEPEEEELSEEEFQEMERRFGAPTSEQLVAAGYTQFLASCKNPEKLAA